MDEQNKAFVQDIMGRIGRAKHLHARHITTETTKRQLRDKLSSMINFINKDVVGTSTSSLIRTTVQIGPDEQGYSGDVIHRMLTINQNGFGTIKVSDQNKNYYGGYQSQTLSNEEFMTHILDKTKQAEILAFLDKNKNKKMHGVCKSIFDNVDILNTLKEISDKYNNTYTYHQFDQEVEIAVPSIQHDDKGCVGETKLKKIGKVVLYNTDRVTCLPMNASDDDMEKVSGYRYHGREDDSDNVDMYFGQIEGTMMLIQIVDEMDKLYSDYNVILDEDLAKAKVVEDKISLEFSTFKFAKEMKQ